MHFNFVFEIYKELSSKTKSRQNECNTLVIFKRSVKVNDNPLTKHQTF